MGISRPDLQLNCLNLIRVPPSIFLRNKNYFARYKSLKIIEVFLIPESLADNDCSASYTILQNLFLIFLLTKVFFLIVWNLLKLFQFLNEFLVLHEVIIDLSQFSLPISKLFEKCIFNQLMFCFTNDNMISSKKYGFRPGFTTPDCLIDLLEEITPSLDQGHYVVSLFLQLSKASIQ